MVASRGGAEARLEDEYGNPAVLPVPTRTGYTFNDWRDSNGQLLTKDTIAQDKTFIAAWNPHSYTVKYNGNGNTGGSTASSSHTYGTAKALTANGFTKTGHTFAGWATSANGVVVYANKESVSNLTATNGATVNLYAAWNPNQYSVSFNAAGGVVSTTSKTVTYGGTYGTLPTPTREGYTFLGWYTASNGGTQVVSGTTVSITGNQTLHARWIETYMVMTDDNGISYTMNNYLHVGTGLFHYQNKTGSEQTVIITLKNKVNSTNTTGETSVLVFCSSTDSFSGLIVRAQGGDSEWMTETLEYIIPNGYYLNVENQNNAKSYITIRTK